MSLRIVSVLDPGQPNLERLHLEAQSAFSLSYFVVLRSAYISPIAIMKGGIDAFWFPDVRVETGHQIVLYTRPGQYSLEGPLKNIRYFSWGLKQTIWNSPNACAVLVQVSGWQTTVQGLVPLTTAQKLYGGTHNK